MAKKGIKPYLQEIYEKPPFNMASFTVYFLALTG